MSVRADTLAVLCGCLFTLAGPAVAQVDGDPATEDLPRVVPYDGVLNLDGAPYDGQADMRFSLYAAPDGGEPLWSESWNAGDPRPVQVTGGRFAVNLGTFEPMEETLYDAGRIYLGIEVRGDGAADWVALAGRQRINPVHIASGTEHAVQGGCRRRTTARR